MDIQIYRYDSTEDREGYYDKFEIEIPKDRNITVMDLLNYISLEIDPTISYYKHSVCNHGICGRCVLLVNDKPKLSCTCIVNDYDTLKLDPMNNRKVIKDLVTESV